MFHKVHSRLITLLKQTNNMNIKTTFLLAVITIAILGCTPQNPQPNPPANNVVAVSWQATINGVSNSYSDSYALGDPINSQGNNEGKCDYGVPVLMLSKGGPYTTGDDVKIEIWQNEIFSVATYNLLPSSVSVLNMVITVNGVVIGHSGWAGSNITLNITEVPSTFGGLIKGNFSGVTGTASLGGIPISGQFQAYRLY
jgi:hypothetical protein